MNHKWLAHTQNKYINKRKRKRKEEEEKKEP
jgi:hypothetical protein